MLEPSGWSKCGSTVAPVAEQAVAQTAKAAVEPAAEVEADVTIPDGWRKLPAAAMKALAAKLGAEAKNKGEAKAAIEAAGG